jgi:histidine phosphotransferase ChpT
MMDKEEAAMSNPLSVVQPALMETKIDLTDDTRLATLLCSRLCHDLISAVGAVNNGVELLREGHEDLMLDAVELIASSGQIAARRISFFRLAFGNAGLTGPQSLADARAAAMALYTTGRHDLIWADNLDWQNFDGVDVLPRLIWNLLFIGDEALARGGQMVLRTDLARRRLTLNLTGRDPQIQDAQRMVLGGLVPVERLDARTVPFYLAWSLFRHSGVHFMVDPHGPGRLDLHLVRG